MQALSRNRRRDIVGADVLEYYAGLIRRWKTDRCATVSFVYTVANRWGW